MIILTDNFDLKSEYIFKFNNCFCYYQNYNNKKTLSSMFPKLSRKLKNVTKHLLILYLHIFIAKSLVYFKGMHVNI